MISVVVCLQNKVLAVLDAIEAAQFLVSQNATNLIRRVILQFISVQLEMLLYITEQNVSV